MNSIWVNTKWVSTVASIWIQSVSGASYAFGIYSSVLKTTQDYNQSTLDVVSVFKDIGANAGILSGLLYGAVARKQGPWVVHVAGAVQCFIGYFFMWASVTGVISRPPVPVMCLFMFLAAHSQTFFNTANVVSGVQNFSDYGGTIVGIMKGFLGLSGAMLIQGFDTFFAGKPSTILLILALLPTTVTLLLMFFVRIYETSLGYEKRHLNYFSMTSLIIAAYLMVIIVLENIVRFQFWVRLITFIILLLLLASPLRIAVKAQRDEGRYEDRFLLERNPLIISPEAGALSKNTPEEDPVEYHELPGSDHLDTNHDDTGNEQDKREINILQALRAVNFWLLFLAMLCGMGSGLATINNINQIGQSLGYTSIEISSLVSLWSIWNFLGRFGAGYGSDILLHNREWARPLFMVITLAAMTVGHIIIAFGFPASLYVGSVLVGICYGSQWSLMPTITSEIFGVENMGIIFNTISIASPVGSYIFSVRVIGYLYDKEASAVDNSCVGTHCFMLSFLIMASVALFGSLIAFTLYMRTRKFYKQVILRRLKHTSSP